MVTYKNIRIKKRGGGTRLQRVQVLASGKYKFVKNVKSKSSNKSTKSKSKSRKRSKGGKSTTTRKRSRRIPLSVITGNVTAIYAPPSPGWATVEQNFRAKNYAGVLQSYIAAWTGLRLGGIGGQVDTEIDILGVLNPFDMRNAPAAKVSIFTKLITRLARKFGINPISRIPFVKDYLSFS